MSVESTPTKGYFVHFGRNAGITLSYRHEFCGPNDLQGASCPNCNKPLLRFLSLDVADPILELEDSPFEALPLLFCWTCNVAQDEFIYKIHADGAIELLHYGKGGIQTNFPYGDYPVFFPGMSVTLEEIPDEDQRIIMALNRDEIDEWEYRQEHSELCVPRHQIGGEPLVVQPLTRTICPLCGKVMPLLAVIGDDSGDGRNFTQNEYVQVIYKYCRNCYTVTAHQKCD